VEMAVTSTAIAPPRGPEAVVAALIEATEALCGVRPPGSITVRQIAQTAGVNHGLVHHYFDSKTALVAATMAAVEVHVLELVAEVDDPLDSVGTFFDVVCDRPTYPRLLSWMLLEGVDPDEFDVDFALIEHLTEKIGSGTGSTDARLRTMALLAFVSGWAANQDFLALAAAITPTERKRSRAWGRGRAIDIAFGTITDRGDPPVSSRPAQRSKIND
jgi:AcrR family transcriptional regulator